MSPLRGAAALLLLAGLCLVQAVPSLKSIVTPITPGNHSAPVLHSDNATTPPAHHRPQEPDLDTLPVPEGINTKPMPTFEFDHMPLPDASHLLLDSPCNTCKHVVKEVSATVAKTQVNEYGVVLATQWMCLQQELSASLHLQCSAWVRVENWLLKGGLITKRKSAPAFDSKPVVNYGQFASAPEGFCEKVQLCGASAQAEHASDLYTGGNSSAVTVRFRFSVTLDMPLSSPSWKAFVKLFLHDVALALSCQPSRLQLHVHKDDPLAEIIILRNGGNEDRDVGFPQYRSALQLGLDLKNIMEGKASYMQTSGKVQSLADPNYEVQVFTLEIPRKGLEKWDLFSA